MPATPFELLLRRAVGLAGSGRRALLGICGPPGAGKSTLAGRLVAAMGDRAALVGMDGFHLAQAELERLGRAGRKGAPDTFDDGGYLALLRRLRADDEAVVYAPEFRREVEEPIAGAVAVRRGVPLVVTEGNYLLHWPGVRPLLDEVWFLAPDPGTRRERLLARHVRYGRTPAEAAARTDGPDERNAELVSAGARTADLLIEKIE